MALKRQRSPAPLIDRLLKPVHLKAAIFLEPRSYVPHVREIATELGIPWGPGLDGRSDRRILHEVEQWVRRYCNFCGSVDLAFPLCPPVLRAFSRSAAAWEICPALDIVLILEKLNTARGARSCVLCSSECCSYNDHNIKDVIQGVADDTVLALLLLAQGLEVVPLDLEPDSQFVLMKELLDEVSRQSGLPSRPQA
jgi:hypothetical protein